MKMLMSKVPERKPQRRLNPWEALTETAQTRALDQIQQRQMDKAYQFARLAAGAAHQPEVELAEAC